MSEVPLCTATMYAPCTSAPVQREKRDRGRDNERGGERERERERELKKPSPVLPRPPCASFY